ncbi:protocatechuate 3,4-dioxygenase alpha subunit [Solirubrobacter pauli]|uniref:Protocatechuate 3,4-dioxygenase alpha subunit n=1 Tax=Solirubrobacter pauli TaxID=166793 RepID=A0A660LHA8_9ACTN|nr:protocatechuate 3,4-dioxygenase subunit alpha [Solirubrobacter pauli]RKQ92171.1 protocatechuate 3,4-dioxygenase alpha subunit [Solirubrobacter pauli]
MTLGTTPSQTVGPYLGIGLPWPDGPDVVPADTPGRIRLHGRVLDGAGDPVGDALIETWQADPDGKFGTDFRGFGRCPTDEEGAWEIFTLKPGRLGDGQAPHVDVNVFARGMLNRCVTRIYFADEDNTGDPVLESVPEERRATIVARPDADGYRFDVYLQGERETVFFKV